MPQSYQTDAVIAQFKLTYNFDPRQCYCLVTGKSIGDIYFDEFDSLIEQLSIQCDRDVESICDDLALRLAASMRPSMRWNKMRMESLNEMLTIAPREVCSYLINRLMQSRNADKQITDQLTRITTWTHILHWDVDSWAFDTCMMQLLRIELKSGLLNFQPYVGTFADFAAFAKWVDSLYNSMINSWEKSRKEAKYIAANPLAKSAFVTQAMKAIPSKANQLKKSKLDFEKSVWQFIDGFDKTIESQEPKSTTPSIPPVNIFNFIKG